MLLGLPRSFIPKNFTFLPRSRALGFFGPYHRAVFRSGYVRSLSRDSRMMRENRRITRERFHFRWRVSMRCVCDSWVDLIRDVIRRVSRASGVLPLTLHIRACVTPQSRWRRDKLMLRGLSTYVWGTFCELLIFTAWDWEWDLLLMVR